MTKNLDNTAISTLKTEFEASYSTAETSLYEIFKALTVLTQSVNFRGAGAESHKLFLQEASLNYAYVLLEVTQTFKAYIEEVEKGFLEYESESSGKVNTDTVSEYKTSLSGIAKQIEILKSDLTSPESIARSHGVSIVSTGAGNLATQFSTIDSNLENVNQDLADTDSSLKGKSTAVSEAITDLKSNLGKISSTYVTSTGKYNISTIGQLTKQDWYLKGSKDVFADKQKSDPFAYNAGTASIWEGQYAVGLAKDTYLSVSGAVLRGEYESGVNKGVNYIKAKGSFVDFDFQAQATSALRVTASGNLAGASGEAKASWENGLYLSAEAHALHAEGNISAFNDMLSASASATGPYAEFTGGLYRDEDSFYLGIDTGASMGTASAGFDLLNFEYKPEGKDKKPIRFLAISVDGKAIGGGDITANISGESVWEDVGGIEWFDVDAVTINLGASVGIGGDLSLTVPWPDLNF